MSFNKLMIIVLLILSVSKIFGKNIVNDSSKIIDNTDSNNTINSDKYLQDPERMFLLATDFALPIHGTFTLTTERTIKHSKTFSITGIVADNIKESGVYSIAVYFGLNYYSKKAFKGWFLAPNIGFKKVIDKSSGITVNLHGGYKWELPHSFLIGIGIGPGIYGKITKKETESRIGFDFIGGAYLGKAFGTYKK